MVYVLDSPDTFLDIKGKNCAPSAVIWRRKRSIKTCNCSLSVSSHAKQESHEPTFASVINAGKWGTLFMDPDYTSLIALSRKISFLYISDFAYVETRNIFFSGRSRGIQKSLIQRFGFFFRMCHYSDL